MEINYFTERERERLIIITLDTICVTWQKDISFILHTNLIDHVKIAIVNYSTVIKICLPLSYGSNGISSYYNIVPRVRLWVQNPPTLDASLTQKKKKIQDLYSTTFHWMGLKLIHPIPVHPPLSFLFIIGKLYTHTQWVLSPQPHPPSNTCKWKSCQLN